MNRYPIAKRGWSQRLYPIAEAVVFVGGLAGLVLILFFASWTGQ